jgi:tripartite-type tricarboxylate transporter receptor subunit TctC
MQSKQSSARTGRAGAMASKLAMVIALSLQLLPGTAQSQTNYPNRPVTLVVPVPPGGILDAVARMVVPSMVQTLGQPFVIDNKAGAGGNIAATYVAKSAPDGYNLLVGYSMFHVGNPSIYPNLS